MKKKPQRPPRDVAIEDLELPAPLTARLRAAGIGNAFHLLAAAPQSLHFAGCTDDELKRIQRVRARMARKK